MHEALFPVALLLDELKSDDVTLRLNAIHRISTIALALGPERTRDELIPFLQDSLDDEDEVLLALADELGTFTEYVGGKEFAHVPLAPLESLAGMEETLVREKACESINKISKELSAEQIEKYYLPGLQRLTNGDWFTARTSACALYASVYEQSNEQCRQDLKQMYKKLCNDDTPMVRRSAAKCLSDFASVLSAQENITDFIPLYKRLASDDQDSVRLLTVEPLISIMRKLTIEQSLNELLPSVRAVCNDNSWRVRYMVGEKFVSIAERVSQDVIRDELVQSFVNLLKDNEAEVKRVTATQIPGFSKFVDQEIILAKILPVVREVAGDQSQHVRAAVATELSGLAPLLGKDETIENLLPIFLQLLKDEFPDVRLNIISKLQLVNDVIGVDYLSKALLPAIFELAEDKQWRVRQAIIEYIPLLAQQLGVEFFNEQLGNLCMSWLGDTVFSIRDSATVNLRKLAEVFGTEWASQTIVPKVVAMGNHSNYLYRMTTVFAITTMSPALNSKIIQEQILSTVLNLVNDPIPNVRFNVAKCLQILSQTLQSTPEGQEVIQREILPSVEGLKDDNDSDVRYFATKALESITEKTDPIIVQDSSEPSHSSSPLHRLQHSPSHSSLGVSKLLSLPAIHLRLHSSIVFLHPRSSDNADDDNFEPPESEDEDVIRGVVELYLPSSRKIHGIEVRLIGSQCINFPSGAYETFPVLDKALEIEKTYLEKGTHKFEFSIIIPSSTPGYERCAYGRVYYYVRARALNAGPLGFDLSDSREVLLVINPNPAGEPSGLSWHHDQVVDGLGPMSIDLESTHLTIGGPVHLRTHLHAPPKGATLHCINVSLLQYISLRNKDRSKIEKAPAVAVRFFSLGSRRHEPLLNPQEEVEEDGWKCEWVGRLPDDDHARPSTVKTQKTSIIISHQILIQIYVTPYDENNQNQMKVVSIRRPIFVSSCCVSLDSITLPPYEEVAPQNDVMYECACGQPLKSLIAKETAHTSQGGLSTSNSSTDLSNALLPLAQAQEDEEKHARTSGEDNRIGRSHTRFADQYNNSSRDSSLNRNVRSRSRPTSTFNSNNESSASSSNNNHHNHYRSGNSRRNWFIRAASRSTSRANSRAPSPNSR